VPIIACWFVSHPHPPVSPCDATLTPNEVPAGLVTGSVVSAECIGNILPQRSNAIDEYGNSTAIDSNNAAASSLFLHLLLPSDHKSRTPQKIAKTQTAFLRLFTAGHRVLHSSQHS
jgi:hypothetical protein